MRPLLNTFTKVNCCIPPSLPLQRINRRSLEDRGGRTTVAVTDSGCSSSGQSPPPLAGLDLASRGLASAGAAAAAAASTALKSSSPPEAEPKHHQHQLIRDHKGSADLQGLCAGHRKISGSPPTACSSNASHAEVKKLRERYFDDAAVQGLGSSERGGYGIGKKASALSFLSVLS